MISFDSIAIAFICIGSLWKNDTKFTQSPIRICAFAASSAAIGRPQTWQDPDSSISPSECTELLKATALAQVAYMSACIAPESCREMSFEVCRGTKRNAEEACSAEARCNSTQNDATVQSASFSNILDICTSSRAFGLAMAFVLVASYFKTHLVLSCLTQARVLEDKCARGIASREEKAWFLSDHLDDCHS